MRFADLKIDFVFRRIFATHADLLCCLLNDLLERSGDRTIEAIEYLPIEQQPLAAGAKLSILDVRCRDRTGTTFVIEMQLVHQSCFINRVVYNACKAYAGQLLEAEPYTQLTDVVAISICNFALWPDAAQRAQDLPLVPMRSRWNVTERKSGNQGLLQVQYVFLELPKLPVERPTRPGAELWAWLFAHATELTEIPEDLRASPYGKALELANQATFTDGELEAYRRVIDEIQQALQLAEDRWVQGLAQGRAEAATAATVTAILLVLAARGIAVPAQVRARIEAGRDRETLDRWIARAATAVSIEDVLASLP